MYQLYLSERISISFFSMAKTELCFMYLLTVLFTYLWMYWVFIAVLALL